jgi:hypothetical protein
MQLLQNKPTHPGPYRPCLRDRRGKVTTATATNCCGHGGGEDFRSTHTTQAMAQKSATSREPPYRDQNSPVGSEMSMLE